MAANSIVVGIDLGTTNSVVAHVDPTGRPTCLPNFEGDLLTPSAVLVESANVVIGREAMKAAPQQPNNYAECFKRHMGEKFFPQLIDGRKWRPEVLSALVLRRLKTDVVRQLGEVDTAVITVPAYFDEARRRATQASGQLGGWKVFDILNEPTAAALAYAHRQGQVQRQQGRLERILVYDLGGGTLDITLLEVMSNQEYRTVATDGEVQLGGHDWDQKLAQHLSEQFQSKTGCDPQASPEGRVTFLQLATNAKRSLSQRPKVGVPCNFEGHKAMLEVTQETFETLTSDLLERSRMTTELVLEQAKLAWKNIDKVILVGGSTRMPMVRRMLHELSGKELDLSLSPDEAIAQGASVYAHLRSTNSGVRVVNVNSHSYRVISVNRKDNTRVAAPLIPKNSPLPRQGSKTFPILRPGMKEVNIVVCEGESEDPDCCVVIGTVRVEDLPQDAGKRWLINVGLTCREDGTIGVEASVRDPEAPKTVLRNISATLMPNRGMSDDEMEKAKQLLQGLEVA